MIKNLKNLMELFTYLYCLSELFGKKFKVGIHVVVFIILDMFLVTGVDHYGFPEYILSLGYMGMFLYGLVCYGESIKLTFINCILAAVVVGVLQLLTFMPLYCLFYIQYEHIHMNELLINIISFLTIILCSHKLKLERLSTFFIRKNELTVGVFILVLFGFAANFYQMKDNGEIASGAYIQVVYFLFIFMFIIYEWQKSRVEAEKRKAQLEMNQLYYDAYDRLLMLVRERQHDMKSHICAILSMIYTTDNYDELVKKQKEYCGYVMEQNEKTRLVLSVGNPLIAGFMYSKIQEAEEKDISVDYEVELIKGASAIPEYELVEMAGILIDNAIEALNSIGGGTDDCNLVRSIYISIQETEEQVEVIVANTSNYYEDDMTERFFEVDYSSKGKGRGIGLSKLKRMVHGRNGEIMVSNDLHNGLNYLTFTIIIPKEKRQKF